MNVKTNHQVVCFGETFWNLLPTGGQAGGSPVNMAYHLQMLGLNPAIISRIGYDDAGKQLIEMLETKSICTDYFQMDERKPTGMLTVYVKDDGEVLHSIHHDVAWDEIEYLNELADLISGARFFVFGSLAVRCKKTYQTLSQLLPFAKTKVLNMNLQAPFYNRTTIEVLLRQADILKLNEPELELITGWFSNYENEIDRVKLLQDKFMIKDIVVNKTKQGSIWISGNNSYEHPGFTKTLLGKAENSDAFLAALLAKMLQGALPRKALEYANATSSLLAMYPDAYAAYKPSEIDALLNLITE